MKSFYRNHKGALFTMHRMRIFIPGFFLVLITVAALANHKADAAGTAGTAGAEGQNQSENVTETADRFTAEFLDVGQGDASLLLCGGHAMLIDGGTADQSQKIYSILKQQSITHLDYIVCTHPHNDHAGGLSGALAFASCGEALAPVSGYDNAAFRTFQRVLQQKNIPLRVPSAGEKLPLGSAEITVLGPTDVEDAMDANNESLVLRVDYGETSFLFTGDAEQEEQQLLLWNEEKELHTTVLKAAHHGAANGASRAFLTAVNPEITVISCGAGNSYGHPHEETLELLKAAGSSLYRTDLQGSILCVSDGKKVSVTTERNSSADVWIPGSEIKSSAQTSGGGDAAEDAAAGITAPADAANAADQQYVLNTGSMKFHRPDCSAVSNMLIKNRRDYTGDRQTLIRQGYSPCKICKP